MVVLEPVTAEPEPKPSNSTAGNSTSPITAGDGDVSEGYVTASETEVVVDDDDDIKNKDLNDVITDQLESKDDQLVQNSVNQEELLAQMNEAKVEGNKLFGDGLYDEALLKYDHAIQLEMSASAEIRAICYNNRATCFFKLEKYEDSVKECTKALELNPTYMKPLLRKAEAHEKLENYDDAITVLKKIVELDPSNHQARRTIFRLEPLAIEKREKMKEEMLESQVDHMSSIANVDDLPKQVAIDERPKAKQIECDEISVSSVLEETEVETEDVGCADFPHEIISTAEVEEEEEGHIGTFLVELDDHEDQIDDMDIESFVHADYDHETILASEAEIEEEGHDDQEGDVNELNQKCVAFIHRMRLTMHLEANSSLVLDSH